MSGGGRRVLTGAILVTVLTNMPVFLIGALATQITGDLHVQPTTIGMAVGAYWAAAAVTSITSALWNRMLGERGLGVTATILAVVSLAGAALVTPDWPWLIIWAVVGGFANGLGHPSSNHAISAVVAEGHRGAAFGAKQAAVPAAGLLAGLSIPMVALTLGWPWAFGLTAALGTLLITFLIGTRRSTDQPPANRRIRLGRAERRTLLVLATATCFAAGAANSAIAFAVTGAVQHGIPDASAGIMLSVASLIGAVLRLAFGILVDRHTVSPLPLISMILGLCTVGLTLMALPHTGTYIAGFLLAGGIGWSWPGLVHLVVSRIAPRATVNATGLVQSGSYLGSALGPVLAGILLNISPAIAFGVLAGLAATAAAMSVLAHRLSIRL